MTSSAFSVSEGVVTQCAELSSASRLACGSLPATAVYGNPWACAAFGCIILAFRVATRALPLIDSLQSAGVVTLVMMTAT